MQRFFPKKSSPKHEMIQVLAHANLHENPARFIIFNEETVERLQIVEELERHNLVFNYDPKTWELSTQDNHSAVFFLKKGLPFIDWDYPRSWRPLKRSKDSPSTKKLQELAQRRLLCLEEIDGSVLSGNERTTRILKNDYGFIEDTENH